MKILLVVFMFVTSASALQTFTEVLGAMHASGEFNRLPHFDQLILVELLASARLGETQAYIDKVGFARVLYIIDRLPASHVVTDALIKDLFTENRHLTYAQNACTQTLAELLDMMSSDLVFGRLPLSEQVIFLELETKARLGELQAYIDKVGFDRVLYAINHLSEKEANVVREAVIKELYEENRHTTYAQIATLTELLDVMHRDGVFNPLPYSEQYIVVKLLNAATLGELKDYIDSVGFASVLSTIDHLPSKEAHVVREALIKELNMENSHTSTAHIA